MRDHDADQRITALFNAHHDRVVAYAARRTHPPGDQAVAQDVAGEVFRIAWQRVAGGPGCGDELTLPWLLVTASNVLSQRTRDEARRAAREDRAAADRALRPALSSVDPADALALSEQVTRALDRLPAGDRELLLLRVWDDLSFAETGQVLGCSTGAARVRWMRARRRFADALTAEEEGVPRPHPAATLIPDPAGDAR